MSKDTVSFFRPYKINHRCAHMPSSCKGRYRHGAIIKTAGIDYDLVAEVHGGRFVEYSGKLFAGGKIRDAFHDWLKAATEKCKHLNDEHEIEAMTALHCAPWQIDQARGNQ